jgi:hypothetical protein
MPSRSSKSWWYISAAAVACAGVLIAGNLAFARHPSAAPAVLLPAAEPVADASSAPARPGPTRAHPQDNTPIGPVVDTGIAAKSGTWALYLIPIDDHAIADTHFGVMLGRRLSGGKLTADVETNETTGSDVAPGFHAAEGSMTVDGGRTPVFGYYAGPAAKVTGKSHGKKVTAHVAASGKAGIQLYWFDATVTTVSGLVASDAHGRPLPTGNSGIGVG